MENFLSDVLDTNAQEISLQSLVWGVKVGLLDLQWVVQVSGGEDSIQGERISKKDTAKNPEEITYQE